MSEWIRLVERDTWGSLYLVDAELVASGKALSPHGTVDWADHALVLRSALVRVRFPDMSEAELPLVVGAKSREVYDHGHSYSVSSPRYTVSVGYHGVNLSLPLTAVEVHRESLRPNRAGKP